MACAEMPLLPENPGLPTFHRRELQNLLARASFLTWPDVWPLGGSYMTATNAENGEQARAKRRILAVRQVSKRAAAL